MNATDLMNEYNRILKIEQKGEKYLDDRSVPDEEKEKHIPRFIEVLAVLGDILYKLYNLGVCYTDKQILNGFEIGGEK